MAQKLKAVPLEDSDSDHLDEDETVKKRLEFIREISDADKKPKRFQGGIIVSTDSEDQSMSTSASMTAVEKKGRKEVAELERELDLKNTFSKETNRRDEDAEMNKYIDEQMREANRQKRRRLAEDDNYRKRDSELADIFTLPASETDNIDDILLHSLSQNHASDRDDRSEAMLSSQMLNGIPEVDLGIDEKIRTIEATEEAKLKMSLGASSRNKKKYSAAPRNYSSNFQHHRGHSRDTRDGSIKSSNSSGARDSMTVTEAVVVVGEEPYEIECKAPPTGERPPPRGKASDDYYLSKFKKYNRK